MSLIQDALKRQQEENNDGAVGSSPAPLAMPVASAPESEPPAESAPAVSRPALQARAPQSAPEAGGQSGPRFTPPQPLARESGTAPWKKIGGIFIFCCLLAWMIVLAISFAQKFSGAEPLFAPGKIIARVKEQIPVPEKLPGLAADAGVPPQPAVVPPPVVETPLPPAMPPSVNNAQHDVPPLPPADAAPEPVEPAPVLAGAAQPSMPVTWPRLKLSAVFRNVQSGQGGARLNDRMVPVGGEIDGVILKEVRADGVVLQCGAETRFLKVGTAL